MKRTVSRIGDIFSVALDYKKRKYFQVIAFDSAQLNSSVIRVFRKEHDQTESPSLSDIVHDEVYFYAHCSTKLGVKLNLWQKVGNVMEVGSLDDIVFRGTNDYGHKLGEEPVKISTNWYVWKINDEKITRVGKLVGSNRSAEIGVVVNPYDIVNRIKTGEYNFFYPGY
jgi:hypothetical protein